METARPSHRSFEPCEGRGKLSCEAEPKGAGGAYPFAWRQNIPITTMPLPRSRRLIGSGTAAIG